MRLRTVLSLAMLLAASSSAALADNFYRQPSMVMTGHGEVTAVPDTAHVTSGVTTQGATARDALDANTAAMAELISTLKDAGIEARDIQTSGFSVNPNYVYANEPDPNGYQRPPKISGYQVFNTVTVRVRDISALGAVLDRAVTVGANTINGVSFSVADPADLYDEARRKAFADAKGKAAVYSDASGVDLNSILSISEGMSVGGPQPQPYMAREMAFSAAAAPVPVQAGELAFAVDVQVEWLLVN